MLYGIQIAEFLKSDEKYLEIPGQKDQLMTLNKEVDRTISITVHSEHGKYIAEQLETIKNSESFSGNLGKYKQEKNKLKLKNLDTSEVFAVFKIYSTKAYET